ncbi:hypothetical protein [Pseudoduganella aquatica]|uniref:Uncharacterized protein n=1 Tax=Pseudoduganella aquatica TaxID=2660641 RepID=A0A7X4H7S2_9BURK|nr:hypothetical protein [Pseudoduganella aquatica]MYN06226.1 hypothetical protein [Pseudoduganella aquatica]
MNRNIHRSVLELKPTTLAELRAALVQARGYATYAMAFEEDMLPLGDDLRAPAIDLSICGRVEPDC